MMPAGDHLHIAQDIQRQLDAGDLENIYVRDDASGSGGDIALAELQARQEQYEQYEGSLEAESEDWIDPSQDESEVMSYLDTEDEASNSFAGEAAEAAEEEVAAVAAGKDTSSTGHLDGPAAESSETDRQDSSSAEGMRDEEESVRNPSTATAAQDSASSAASISGRESTSQLEGQQKNAARARQAEKLAKQRELFGASFSTPKRFVQIPPPPGMQSHQECS